MIANGSYTAHLCATAIIHYGGKDDEPEEGRSLMAYLPFEISEGEFAGEKIDTRICFRAKDGSWMLKTIENMQEVFGMVGANPYWLQFANPDDMADSRERDLSSILCTIVIEEEIYKGKPYPRIKWINKLGRSGGAIPKSADRAAFMAKHGERVAGLSAAIKPKPLRPESAAPASAPAPGRAPAPASKPVAPSCADDCFGELKRCNPSLPQTKLEDLWFSLLKKFSPKDQGSYTPEDWGRFLLTLEDDIPF